MNRVCVFCHGFMESKVLPGENLQKMLERYGQLLKPDFASAVSDISEQLGGYEEIILIGHSMGVLAAYRLLKRLRDSGDKKKISFVACEPLTAVSDVVLPQRMLLRVAACMPARIAADFAAQTWPPPLASTLNERERHTHLTDAFPFKRTLAEAHYIARQLPLEAAVFNDVPTAVIWSRNDRLLRRRRVDRTLQRLLGPNLKGTFEVDGEHGHILENQIEWYKNLHRALCSLNLEPLRR